MSDSATSLCLDQRRRWNTGDHVPVEAYIAQMPGLHEDSILDLIYNEIVLREGVGDTPELAEYVGRFPQFESQLQIQFHVHRAIEGSLLDSDAEAGACGNDGERSEKSPLPSVPGFEILGEIGRGGMGVVYRARQLRLKRLVALKVIRSGPHASDQERKRFQTEAEAVARLRHANVVQIHEIGEHEGLSYLCLELVDGCNLEALARGRAFPPEDAAAFVEGLARTLHHVHEHGIVHRDLKPANVLLQRIAEGAGSANDFSVHPSRWRHKVTDFGLAKLLQDAEGPSITRTLVGTPHYMAPEQAQGHGALIGPAVDVYALGAILYELLTGQPPFHGKALLEVLDRVRTEEPTPPSRLAANMPLDLDTICLKCLQKRPEQRYASALDLAEDLRRFGAHETILARRSGWLERGGKWIRRRPALTGVAVVSLAAVLLVGALDRQHEQNLRETRNAERSGQLGLLDEARGASQKFAKFRGEALFHWSFTSQFPEDGAQHVKAMEAAIAGGLALINLDARTCGKPTMNPYWSEREKKEVLAGAYQLMLIHAEATALRLPEQTDEAHRDRVKLALAGLDHMAETLSPTPALHLRRARYLDSLQDTEAAQHARQSAQQLSPTGLIDYLLLGDEWFQQRDYQQAARCFQQALQAEPSDFWSKFFLALCRINLQQPQEADSLLSQCLRERPDFSWALVYRGMARGELGDLSGGEKDLAEALAARLPSEGKYVVLLARSRLLLRGKQLERAAADLEEAVALLPRQFHARFNLAKIYQSQGKLEASSAQIDQAMALLAAGHRTHREVALLTAECQAERASNLHRSRQYTAALQAADAALKAEPSHREAHYGRGLALLELGRPADALVSLEKVSGPFSADLLAARGRARMKLGDFLRAKDDYTRALEFGPSAELYLHRGWAYYFSDAWKLALHDFQEAARLAPANADAYVGRGLAQMMQGQLTEALKDAEEAERRRPSEPEMMHNLACIFALAAARQSTDAIAAKRCRERAVRALQQTLAMVSADQRAAFWRDKILPDPALDSLRDDPDFRRLMMMN